MKPKMQSTTKPNQAARLFLLSVLLLIPTLLFSSGFQNLLGFELGGQALRLWLPATLATCGLVVCGRPQYLLAVSELRQRRIGQHSIKSLALLVSFVSSASLELSYLFAPGGPQSESWWQLAALLSLLLLGFWIQVSVETRASLALNRLVTAERQTVVKLRGKTEETVAFQDLKVGDSIQLAAGQTAPVDGELSVRSAEVTNALLGWRSKVLVRGQKVFAGSHLDSGSEKGVQPVKIRVTAIGDDRYLQRVIQMVLDGQLAKSKTARFVGRLVGWLAYLILAVAFVTAVVWALEGKSGQFIADRVLGVLVGSNPFALSIAMPVVAAAISLSTTERGILIRDSLMFYRARKTKILVFNKTGTLTTGVRQVVKAELAVGNPLADVAELVALAAGLEAGLSNSVALAISAEAKRLKVEPVLVRDQMVMPGQGVSARIEGYRFSIGGPSLLTQYGISIAVEDLMRVGTANSAGDTVVYVLRDSTLLGYLMLSDQLRSGSKKTVEALQDLGVRVVMLTGDDNGSANALARDLGIDEVYAEVLPHQKAQVVQSLQVGRKKVAMVGDGFEDSAALEQADIGMAFGAGGDLQIESAGIILTGSEPKTVVETIKFSRLSSRKTGQNVIFAIGYNLAVMLLASGLLPGLSVSALLATVLLSLSTLIVVANAQLIRRR